MIIKDQDRVSAETARALVRQYGAYMSVDGSGYEKLDARDIEDADLFTIRVGGGFAPELSMIAHNGMRFAIALGCKAQCDALIEGGVLTLPQWYITCDEEGNVAE